MKELRAAAPVLKLKLEEIETQPDAKGLESAFQIAKQKRVNAILVMANRPFFAERKRIVELAGKYRFPANGYRVAAVYVDKILKGTKPADLPVQQAMKIEFIINLKAAKQIGHTMPYDLLCRANQVIK
ncbi:MAG: hypothetical protein HYU46_00705 [Deltaproteobacteria bacterium]|nr:hypothetical protein [Deltaproteobacteria bacterium]